MTTTISLLNDFEDFIDNLEPVTLRRRNSTKELLVKNAYRQQAVTQEMVPSSGTVLQADAVWQLQLPVEEGIPQLGDVVIDQQKNRWTILRTEELANLGRWKCTTRELRIAYDCTDRVDIDRPVWGDIGSGPEIVEWTAICTALPVNIQLDEMTLDTSTTPPTKQLMFKIILSESIALEPDDRLTAEEGVSYRLQSLHQAMQLNALPVASALREEA